MPTVTCNDCAGKGRKLSMPLRVAVVGLSSLLVASFVAYHVFVADITGAHPGWYILTVMWLAGAAIFATLVDMAVVLFFGDDCRSCRGRGHVEGEPG